MDDVVAGLIAAAVLVVAVIFDWPRAVAGALIAFLVRWVRLPVHPLVAGAVAIVAVAGLGELLYPLYYAGYRPSLNGFLGGLFVSGACTFGLWRALCSLLSQ